MAGTPVPVNVQQDFQLIPLLNVVAEPVTGSVTASADNVGKLYRNTTTKNLEYVWDATTVIHFTVSGKIVNADIDTAAAIALSKLATDPLDRGNHTGTQLAATISDFDTEVRTSRLDQMAVPGADVNLNGHKATGAADAVSNTDLTTLQQVQNLLSAAFNGQDWKASVKVASGGASSQGNINLAAPGANIDGVAMSANDRFIAAAQTTGSQDGIYVYNGAAVAATRSADADAGTEVTSGMTVPVEQGSNSDTLAILTTDGTITLGTTSLAFTFLKVAGAYTSSGSIQIVGNVISIVSGGVSVGEGGTGSTTAAGARGNLGTNKAGFTGLIGALTAGTGLDVTHSLALTHTHACIIQVMRESDGLVIPGIGAVAKDANTVTITSDVAVSASALRLNVLPLEAA